MFTVSKAAFTEFSLTPIQRGHVGGAVDQGIIEYLQHQCRQNGKKWCIVALKQIQNNLELTRGIERCLDTISDHLHRLEALGYLEIQKRTRRLADGSLFTGRNFYRLTERLFASIERGARKVFHCLEWWLGWKVKLPDFSRNYAQSATKTIETPEKSISFQSRGEKTPDSTEQPEKDYRTGAPLRGSPDPGSQEKGSATDFLASLSPRKKAFEEWTEKDMRDLGKLYR